MKFVFSVIIALSAGALAAPVARSPLDGQVAHSYDTRAEADSKHNSEKRAEAIEADIWDIWSDVKAANAASAYDDEIRAVKNPADVLGKRTEAVEADIWDIWSDVKAANAVSAYDDEVKAVKNPADVLGRRTGATGAEI